MKRVIARMMGGLGNQLFIYAAARCLSIKNQAELVLDDVSGFTYDHEYQRKYQLDHLNIPCRKATSVERFEPFARPRRYTLRRWNALYPFEQRNYIQQVGLDFEPRLLSLRIKGRLYLEGYWQSEGYFKDIESTIREDLRITPPRDCHNGQMAQSIRKELSVAVHVRFFDQPDTTDCHLQKNNNTPSDYYHRAIERMEQRVPGAHYFIFSDHPKDAKLRLHLAESRTTLVQHNQGESMAYADLWLMTQCQHFIIANSTFSWWGAWLSTNPSKFVIAPKLDKELSLAWSDPYLLPSEWDQL